MNQKVLGALRAIGMILLFTIVTAVIGKIPDILTAIPYIGPLVTPTISLALTAYASMKEHQLADNLGYNLPPGTFKAHE